MTSILKLEDLLNLPGWNTRKKIMEELKTGPKNAYELAEKLKVNYSTIKYHLELLQRFGLVRELKRGRKSHYELTKNGLNLLEEGPIL